MMVLAVEMMIPMKSSSMTVMMAMISPSGREFPPADFFLQGSFSLSGVFRLVEVAEYFDGRPLCVRAPRGQVREGGTAEVGQGPQTTWRRGWWARRAS